MQQPPTFAAPPPSQDQPAYTAVKPPNKKKRTSKSPSGKQGGSTSGPKAKPALTVTGHPTVKVESGSQAPVPSFDASKESSVARSWPPDLRDYVTRAYQATDSSRRAQVETELKSLIMAKIKEGLLMQTEWEREPLPAGCQPVQKPTPNPPPKLLPTAKTKTAPGAKNAVKKQAVKCAADSPDMLAQRAARFSKPTTDSAEPAAKAEPAADVGEGVLDWDEHTIVGTSTQLEKPYLRLTSAPDPRTVRPLAVLTRTLDHLLTKWQKERNYPFIREQFKSVRQDLTVQRIQNAFTVRVYETHARIAIETGDLGEYNLCQTKLAELYRLAITGHELEFLAYRILYLIHVQKKSDMAHLLSQLTPEQKRNPAVEHALNVRTAVVTSNYHRLFTLYRSAPNMNVYLMNHFVPRERVLALMAMSKSYRSDLSVQFICQELAFASVEVTKAQLQEYNATLAQDKAGRPVLKCKESLSAITQCLTKASKSDITGQI
ncbi:hypothetical protein IWQ60_002470 [Tieghemiomyces parasiticus]|uniref:SAC3/GANP/THP3 conserved domain-containing protein n=1 Tax=Tieghemiomyces parasiticus TaxID=78921 RepID=A0A9W8E112_9FUNG|nr:hypothetical protein IWQ60_002470 [Tieghemiomyces parasiticus]